MSYLNEEMCFIHYKISDSETLRSILPMNFHVLTDVIEQNL